MIMIMIHEPIKYFGLRPKSHFENSDIILDDIFPIVFREIKHSFKIKNLPIIIDLNKQILKRTIY
jgi:hypothetical protein